MAVPKIIWADDIDIAWHLDGNEVVFDRCNIGGEPAALDKETFNAIWPGWMLEAAKGSCK